MNSGFCITGQLEQKCKTFTFGEFSNEKGVIVLILEYFKVGLPLILEKFDYRDYYNEKIRIDPKDIDLMPQKDFGKYLVILAITDDTSTYKDQNFQIENTEYVFQIELRVSADSPLASFENLIKLKSAIKTLLVNMDDNINLTTEIGDFGYTEFQLDEANQVIRNGIYRFSIQQLNVKK